MSLVLELKKLLTQTVLHAVISKWYRQLSAFCNCNYARTASQPACRACGVVLLLSVALGFFRTSGK